MNRLARHTVRGLIEFLQQEGEILVSDKEIDIICEAAGVTKALEDGPAALFEKVKGYPGHRYLLNLFGRKDRTAKIFGVPDPRKFKHRIIEAIRNPIPPVVIDRAPCQEVLHKKNINVNKLLPVSKSIETDPGRVITGGIALFSGPEIGNCISFRRTHFRGKDWASISIIPESHMERYFAAKGGVKFPFTLNITCPPAVMTVAAAGMSQLAIPSGTDEVGIAGALQNGPVEICRAKTVDAYAIADAEYVIEGYLDTSKIVWESDQSEREQKDFVSPFLNEWRGYMGWAHTTYKFEATAITHKKDRPIYYATTAGLFDEQSRISPFTEAALFELADKMCPGLVKDVHILHCMKGQMGAVFQVQKRRRNDDRFSRSLIPLAFCGVSPLQMVIVVDEDVNIYNADDILWALTTRIIEKEAILDCNMGKVAPRAGISLKTGIDATIPFDMKGMWKRSIYPKIDLERWFSSEEIEGVRRNQSEYARFMADSRR
jgi:gallate decarboxylase subunit C